MIDYQNLRTVSLQIHIIAGFIALTSFWLIIFLPKKTLIHKKLGQLYLVAILIIMLTSITNFFVLKNIFNFSHDDITNGNMFNYTFFSLISILAFTMTLIPIWFISQKNKIAELQTSKLTVTFFIICLTITTLGLFIGILNFSNSLLLVIYGLLLTPYMLGPVLSFLSKIKKNKISEVDLLDFHISSLLKSGILVHVAFLTGGARVRYLHNTFDEKQLLAFTVLLILIFAFQQNRIVRLFKKTFNL